MFVKCSTHCAQKGYVNVKDDFPDLKRIIIERFYSLLSMLNSHHIKLIKKELLWKCKNMGRLNAHANTYVVV